MSVKVKVETLIEILALHDDGLRISSKIESKAEESGDSDMIELAHFLRQEQRAAKEKIWSYFIRSISGTGHLEERRFEIENLAHEYFVAGDDDRMQLCRDIVRAIQLNFRSGI
jgi:hypothetical protein